MNGATPGNRWNVERRDGPNIGWSDHRCNCWLDPAGAASPPGRAEGWLADDTARLNDENVDYLPLAAHPEGEPGPTDTPTPGDSETGQDPDAGRRPRRR